VHYHKVGESTAKIIKTKEGSKIQGVLAIPRVSRNNVLYLPEQLARNHGKTIVVDLEHNHNHNIGFARLSWNKELQRLEYSGQISDREVETRLKDGVEYHTSLEGGCESEEICGENTCYTACISNTNIERMALVLEPGIPETTVNITESVPPFSTARFDSSLNQASKKSKPLSQESKTVKKECGCTKEMDGDGSHDCPEGKKWDAEAGQCVAKETFAVTPEVEEKLVTMGWYKPKKEQAPVAVIDPDSTLGKKAIEATTNAFNVGLDKREAHSSLVGKEEQIGRASCRERV